jgi:hypothetical protein
MKRAAIIVLAIATLVLIVSPSASVLARTPIQPRNSAGVTAPTVSGPLVLWGPSGTPPTGAPGGGGTDEGDADGLSGYKVKPAIATSNYSLERMAITVMMWWRYQLLIR